MVRSLPFYKRYFKTAESSITEPRVLSHVETVATEIVQLFEKYGAENYEGGPVSQASHMVQCAMLAMENISDLPLVIGALLHDIGLLLKHDQVAENMNGYNVVNHEDIGAAFLRNKGFSERVCAIVEHHAAAKRYLVTDDKAYHVKLSRASQQALRWQGGPMTTAEATAFETHPFFTDIIKVGRWDEEAKKKNAALLPVAYFRRLLWDHLSRTIA